MRTYVRDRRVISEFRDKVYSPHFVDPWFWLNGSEPEHMVMAELERRGIYFEYRNQDNTLGGFVDPTWEADIFIPQHKIWIEIQGSYYHTLPGQLKNDAIRYAAVKQAGWRPLFWWEWDIRTRLMELVDSVPEFHNVNAAIEQRMRRRRGTSYGLGFKVGANSDQLVGHRNAMHGRAAPQQFYVRRESTSTRSPKTEDR